MREQIKHAIDLMYGLFDRMQSGSGWNQNLDIRDIFKVECIRLMMYLSASDGEIAVSEAEAIGYYFDLYMTPTQLLDFIKQNNIYSTDFENTVPLSIRMLVELDNKLAESDDGEEANPTSELALKVFGMIAMDMMAADGEISEAEKADWEIYSGMIQTYINENLNVKKQSVKTGLTKNGSVSAPSKGGGVSAPKKG
ncbi:MAG: hypothetical protein Q4E57_05165 [Eubacteriales bacterium]|nr:hypothetical protein [Eubacteriales bacterium]